jgi:hypothetical protein
MRVKHAQPCGGRLLGIEGCDARTGCRLSPAVFDDFWLLWLAVLCCYFFAAAGKKRGFPPVVSLSWR